MTGYSGVIGSNSWSFSPPAFYLWHSLAYLLELEGETIFEFAVVHYDGEKFEGGYAVESGGCGQGSEPVKRWSPFGEIGFCALSDNFTLKLLSTAPQEFFLEWITACFLPQAKFSRTYDGWTLNISSSKRLADYNKCLTVTGRIFPHMKAFSFPKKIRIVHYVGHPEGLELSSLLSSDMGGFGGKRFRDLALYGEFVFRLHSVHVINFLRTPTFVLRSLSQYARLIEENGTIYLARSSLS